VSDDYEHVRVGVSERVRDAAVEHALAVDAVAHAVPDVAGGKEVPRAIDRPHAFLGHAESEQQTETTGAAGRRAGRRGQQRRRKRRALVVAIEEFDQEVSAHTHRLVPEFEK